MKSLILGIAVFTMLFTTSCSNETAQTTSTSEPTTQAATQATQTPETTQEIVATQAPDSQSENDKQENKEEKTVNIIIEMQDGGIIKAELYPDVAPLTVANFEKLINEKFFDGLIFHRVIKGFMIQGGGYDTNYDQKEADSIKGEFSSNGVENNLKHDRGVLSMARTAVKDSASSQFFIMHQAAPHLDGEYAAFGKVTEGLEIVDKIAGVQTDMQDCPVEPQVIKTIRFAE